MPGVSRSFRLCVDPLEFEVPRSHFANQRRAPTFPGFQHLVEILCRTHSPILIAETLGPADVPLACELKAGPGASGSHALCLDPVEFDVPISVSAHKRRALHFRDPQIWYGSFEHKCVGTGVRNLFRTHNPTLVLVRITYTNERRAQPGHVWEPFMLPCFFIIIYVHKYNPGAALPAASGLV